MYFSGHFRSIFRTFARTYKVVMCPLLTVVMCALLTIVKCALLTVVMCPLLTVVLCPLLSIYVLDGCQHSRRHKGGSNCFKAEEEPHKLIV